MKPCQDLSMAGRRAGMADGTRSGLWTYMSAAIETLRPQLVIAENVRGLLSGKAHSKSEQCEGCVDGADLGHRRALGTVLADLARLGYDAQWVGLQASDVGAPHRRFRVIVVAHLATDTDTDSGRWNRWTPDQRWGQVQRTSPTRDSPNDGPTANTRSETSALRTGPCANDQSRFGRPRPDNSAVPTADTGSAGLENLWPRTNEPQFAGNGSDHVPATDTRRGPRPEEDADLDAAAWHRGITPTPKTHTTDFGKYGPAIRRWETILGRDAPAPTQTGPRGGQRLSPHFVEWMMGLPAGHVTNPAIGLSRATQLKALGNGVVPQQIEAALRHLLASRSEPE